MKKYVKKTSVFALTTAMIFSLTACDGNINKSASEETDLPVQSVATASTAKERTVTYPILLDGTETTAYLEIGDEEITLWDSAADGQIIAVAKYAQPMSDAAEALQNCDFTDLDEDGNSDLTASFSFTDGTTANLTWFYVNGGFVYNEEFSVLPGDAPFGDEK